jgi:hypothetical protein
VNSAPRVRFHEHHGNGRNEWLTPPEIIRALGGFDLDPAATCGIAHDGKPWKTAATAYCRCSDGLSQPWVGRVWLNPPYDQAAEAWLDRLAKHGNGIALVFARTETVWFKRVAWDRADAMMFLHRRLHFCLPDGTAGGRKGGTGSAGAASVLVAYGKQNVEALMGAALDGFVVRIWDERREVK